MRRVCIIGNSHVGAIKGSADILKSDGALDQIELTFFASPQDSMKSCSVVDGTLSSTRKQVQKNFEQTSGGSTEIKIEEFDEFLIFLGSSALSVAPFYDTSSLSKFHDLPALSSGMVSKILSISDSKWNLRICREIARLRPVTQVGKPFRSDQDPNSKAILSKLDQSNGDIAGRLNRLQSQLKTEMAARTDENIVYAQPLTETLEPHSLFTRHEFCTGSQKIAEGGKNHKADDFLHMNAKYGELQLRRLLSLS